MGTTRQAHRIVGCFVRLADVQIGTQLAGPRPYTGGRPRRGRTSPGPRRPGGPVGAVRYPGPSGPGAKRAGGGGRRAGNVRRRRAPRADTAGQRRQAFGDDGVGMPERPRGPPPGVAEPKPHGGGARAMNLLGPPQTTVETNGSVRAGPARAGTLLAPKRTPADNLCSVALAQPLPLIGPMQQNFRLSAGNLA